MGKTYSIFLLGAAWLISSCAGPPVNRLQGEVGVEEGDTFNERYRRQWGTGRYGMEEEEVGNRTTAPRNPELEDVGQ